MRILIHHRTRGANVEGVHLREISAALRDLGHEVRVIGPPGTSIEPSKPGAGEPRGRGWLGTLASRLPEFLFELAEMGYNLLALWRLWREARRFSPDLVYERYALFLFAGVLTARWRKIPIILEINDSAFLPRARPLLFRRLAGWMEQRIINASSGAVYVSQRFEDLVRSHMPLDVPTVICPNAVNLALFDPARADGAGLRRRLGLEDRVVCGFIGSFVPWHGVSDFLEVCASRLRECPELVLLLVGDGPDHGRVAERVRQGALESQVVLAGRVPHTEIPDYLAAMDFGLLPNSNEYGSPMKLFEFMAMGCPPVAPDVPPVREVIRDGDTGWLFPAGDLAQATARVLKMAADPQARRRVAANARRQVEQRHRWIDNASRTLTLLEPTRNR